MCGINGFISKTFPNDKIESVIKNMNGMIAHRGPDNEGLWKNEGICLGHRRLSIIDLSIESNQPFFSQDRRYVIIYNGELYNYRELKLDLQRSGHEKKEHPYFFKTASDTEVILAAFIRWGNKCLELFNGMFAFAIYDTQEKKLFMARDRMGVKPLYYYFGEEGFIFSSEIRAIIHSGIKSFSLNKDLIGEYALYQTVFAPNTIIKGIKILMPGCYAEYYNDKATLTSYYSPTKKFDDTEKLSYKEICDKTNELLTLSVQRRMIADVPFGAFLSGGIDSSAIVGLMSKISEKKIKTFTISFDESDFSESKYAKIIATKFNTEHHDIKLSPIDFLKEIPAALSSIDHPGGDAINTYLVSKATKKEGVTVALSGIGGDELFAGYDVFKRMAELQKKSWINSMPLFFRKSAGYFIQKNKKSVAGNKIEELLNQSIINFKSAYPLNRSVFTQKELNKLINNSSPFKQINAIVSEVPQIEKHLLSAVSVAEITTYLQNVLLRDADQMSMAMALEIREPFLDYQLIDFVLGINDEKKYPHTPKKLLVDSLGELLPSEIINRKKMGFTLPWQIWLKKDLKSFCEKNITEFSNYDFCNKEGILNLWKKFLNNDEAITWSRIWHLVVLNNWIKENKIDC